MPRSYLPAGCPLLLVALAALTARPAAAQDAAEPVLRSSRSAPPSVERVRRRTARISQLDAAPRIVYYPVPTYRTERYARTLRTDGVRTRRALDRLEDRLLRRLDRQLSRLYERLGVPAPQIELYAPGAPPSPDSLPRAAPPAAGAGPPASPPTVPTPERIERALLDTGLFRALGVNFEVNESTLLPRAEAILDNVGEVLQAYPALRLEVMGHTDASGPAAYNQPLSAARAEAVRSYLLERFDIGPDRLVARGYGESQPIASNETATGRTLNRRVVFTVLNPEAAEQYLPPDSSAASPAQQLRRTLRRTIREEIREANLSSDSAQDGTPQ